MAGRGTSLSLTFGVAFATLVVVGGILAVPAVVDCSHQPQSFGACLRDKVQHSGLGPKPAPPVQMPVASSELAPPDKPPVVAEAPPQGAGWIEAHANEYEPAVAASVELSAPAGTLAASGGALGVAPDGAGVLAAPGGKILAEGGLAPGSIDGDVDVSASPGILEVTTPEQPGAVEAVAELQPPAGQLAAEGGLPPDQPAVAADLSALSGQLDVSGASGTAIEEPAVALLGPTDGTLAAAGANGAGGLAAGSIDPSAPRFDPPMLSGAVGTSANPTAEVRLEATIETPPAVAPVAPKPKVIKIAPKANPPPKKPAKIHKAERQVYKDNPRFPNVTLLPSPNKGEESSFATLKTR